MAWSCIQRPAHRKVYDRPLWVIDIIGSPHQGKSGLVSLVLATPLTIVPPLPLQRLVGYNNALRDRGRLTIRCGHLLLCCARDRCSESCYFTHDNCRRDEPSSWVCNIESVYPEKTGLGSILLCQCTLSSHLHLLQ